MTFQDGKSRRGFGNLCAARERQLLLTCHVVLVVVVASVCWHVSLRVVAVTGENPTQNYPAQVSTAFKLQCNSLPETGEVLIDAVNPYQHFPCFVGVCTFIVCLDVQEGLASSPKCGP